MIIKEEILNQVKKIYEINNLKVFKSGLNGQTFKYSNYNLIKVSGWNVKAYGHLNLSTITNKLEYVKVLKSKGVKTPQIHYHNNELVKIITFDNGNYIETYITYLMEKLNVISNQENFYYDWGRTLGQIHDNSNDNIQIPNYKKDFSRISDMCIDNEAKEIFNNLGKEINSIPINIKNYGLLHGDPQPNNFLNTEDGMYVIDFDNMFEGFFLHDIAIGLEFIFENIKDIKNALSEDEKTKIFEQFIKGYNSVIKLDDEILSKINLFLSYRRAMRFIGLYKVLQKDSDNFENVRQKVLTNEKILNIK